MKKLSELDFNELTSRRKTLKSYLIAFVLAGGLVVLFVAFSQSPAGVIHSGNGAADHVAATFHLIERNRCGNQITQISKVSSLMILWNQNQSN